MIDFQKILVSKETGLQNRIQEVLSKYPKFKYPLDWEEHECSRDSFSKISIDKFSKSMAHEMELMSKSRAAYRLKQLINKFDENCRFFTNWDIGINGKNSGSWTPVTDFTFDCCLIIMDQSRIGVIVMVDED